jgi:hypothetical protein
MKAMIAKNRLAISLPIFAKPRPSNSGKSMLVASTRGIRKASFTFDGEPVYVVASAFVRRNRTLLTSKNEKDPKGKRDSE